jgi:DNA-binding MarR family transcriptional regulator
MPDEEKYREFMELDKDIHVPARLMILSILYVQEYYDFVALRVLTELTWGNLSAHIKKLEEKELVKIEKTFKKNKPLTIARITERGRKALLSYREKMKNLL